MTETIDVRAARRLALCRAGLLKPEWTDMPKRASGYGKRARTAAHRIVQRFGYLQLDTVSIAGARSHSIVLHSRFEGFDPAFAEELLQPGEPIFEYWGHEASWIPIELYPTFGFRREDFRHHPWWGDLIGEHPEVAKNLRRRIRDEGPLRSLDMEGGGSKGWWDLKVAKKVASAMWSSGELAIRERRNFQRTYDLTERVIPERWRREIVPKDRAIETLALRALAGHGWATTGTIAQTFRVKQGDVIAALDRLAESNDLVPCSLVIDRRKIRGWIRPSDLELSARLEGVRPRRDRGVLLSPFDPLLWDRNRVQQLFAFHQMLEIFKPAEKRIYGYYCLPVLAGERLVARFDLKADRKHGSLEVLCRQFEGDDPSKPASTVDEEAARIALDRFAQAIGLSVEAASAG
ncbi:MAG: winged helix DNA-binding domain-containing protein [Thermoanaerobaculales bacterium]|nr:winged helix DNA-binding domain-containing protein [Thermoanaerobaculales bacterium]